MFETISNTVATFLNLHIGKARKTVRDNKQLYLITHDDKLFTAPVKCNGTVISLSKKDRVILFRSLNSRSMVATSSFGSLSTMLYTSDLKWQTRLEFPVLRRTYLLSTVAFNRLATHFSSSSRVL